MYNLDEQISDWRRQMLAAGIKSPVPMEELEIHLREDIERQIKSGIHAQQAFEAAIMRIGQARALKLEFKKVAVPMEARLIKLLGLACGITAGLFSLWLLLVLLFVREANLTERILGMVAVASIVLSWRYAGKFLPAIHRQRARTALGFLCCLASIGGMILFIHLIALWLPAGFAVGHMLVSCVWAWAALAIFGVAAYRLEHVIPKNNGQHV